MLRKLFGSDRARRGRDSQLSSKVVADFGRAWYLDGASDIDIQEARGATYPLAQMTFQGDPQMNAEVIRELQDHAQQGPWELVGAWLLARDLLNDESLTDQALRQIAEMRITNLAIHLAQMDVAHYSELTGGPPPNDGYFGPAAFDSSFGPSRDEHFDRARDYAISRSRPRLRETPGVDPGELDTSELRFWDFGRLIALAPFAIGAIDCRDETQILATADARACASDHEMFANRLTEALLGDETGHFNGWALLGAGRFIEESLDPKLNAGSQHMALIDGGLTQLDEQGMVGTAFRPDVLTEFEQSRLASLRSSADDGSR